MLSSFEGSTWSACFVSTVKDQDCLTLDLYCELRTVMLISVQCFWYPDLGSLRAVNPHWKGSACMFSVLTADHSLSPCGIIRPYWCRLISVKQDWPQQRNPILTSRSVASCLYYCNKVVILLDLAALRLIKFLGMCNLSEAFHGFLSKRSTMVGFMVVQSIEGEPASLSSPRGSPAWSMWSPAEILKSNPGAMQAWPLRFGLFPPWQKTWAQQIYFHSHKTNGWN